MIRPIAASAKVELIFISSFSTDLTWLTVQAFPVWLEHLLDFIGGKLQTISMETFWAKQACNEVILISKRSTQVAHLLKYESWVIERAPDWVWVIAPLVVFTLVMLHHLLAILVFEYILSDHVMRRVTWHRGGLIPFNCGTSWTGAALPSFLLTYLLVVHLYVTSLLFIVINSLLSFPTS